MAGLYDWTTFALVVAALLALNGLGVVLTALQLPGTWFMLLVTPLVAWAYAGVRWSETLITWWTPIAMLVLAILGEVVETAASAWGAGKAGGTKRGMVLAIFGGIVGAIVATFALAFLPILGTILGAAIGAGVGSALGDRWAGREWGLVWRAGRGAAVGRFWGAVGKLAIAGLMFAVVVVALVWS